LGTLRRVHEPILDSLASKRIVGTSIIDLEFIKKPSFYKEESCGENQIVFLDCHKPEVMTNSSGPVEEKQQSLRSCISCQ
jgi:hypothetical protein